MKKRNFIGLLCGFLLLGCPSKPTNDIRIVTAQGGLKLRAQADINSETILVIPNGARVTIIRETTGDPVTIAGSTGRWSEITYESKTGWAFGGFLTPEHGNVAPSGSTSSQLTALAGNYFASGPVEPGNMSDWLTVTSNSVAFGRGGMMNADWYCLAASASSSGATLTITCDKSRTPTKAEVEFPSGAQSKDVVTIATSGSEILVAGQSFRKR